MAHYDNQFGLSFFILVFMLLSSNLFSFNQGSIIKKYFKEGSTAVLQCPFKSCGFPLIWMKGRKLKLISSNHLIVSTNQPKLAIIGNHSFGEYILVIDNFTTDDQGLYRCQGITEHVAFAQDIRTILAIPPSNIEIVNKTQLNTIELLEGRNSDITCIVSNGIPRAQLVLNVNGNDVMNGSNSFLTLQLNASTIFHMKRITCTAYHSFLEKPLEDIAVLFVYMLPKIHISAMPSKDIIEGSNLTLKCVDSSNVATKNYSWEFDGSLLTNVTSNLFEIEDINKKDSGIYACHIQNMIGSSVYKLTVNVHHQPYLLANSSSSLKYKTEVGSRVLVSIPVESNPGPLTVSFLNITDLKLDEWIIDHHGNGSNVYLLSTTLFPIHTKQYGVYVILVRNQYGSLKVQINLNLPDVNVTVFPDYPLCDVSENLTLSCTVHQKNFNMWTNSWIHWINGTFIRNVSGIVKGNTSFLYFPFCDYQDFGTYECKWVLRKRQGISSVFVSVNSAPVKTYYRKTISKTDIILSVDIFSREPIRSIDWYENGLTISNTSEKYKSSWKMTDIILSVYKQRLTISGFEIGLKIGNANFSDIAIYICHITNEYGSTDIYFETDQFLQNTIEHRESMTFAEDLSTRLKESTNGSIYKLVVQNHPFIISGLVLICVILSICAIIWRIRKGHRKVTVGKQNESDTTGQQHNQSDELNESEYAEIEDDYYHSVEWRVYPSGIVISPRRSRSNHSLVPASSDHGLEEQTNVYLEVIPDSESLKDEQTTMFSDKASTVDDSFISKTSGSSSSSYIQTIMRNSLDEPIDLIHVSNDVSEAETNSNYCSELTNSQCNSSGSSGNPLCMNTKATKTSEKYEFRGKPSVENMELCENKQMAGKYEKLNLFQTDTHLYNQN